MSPGRQRGCDGPSRAEVPVDRLVGVDGELGPVEVGVGLDRRSPDAPDLVIESPQAAQRHVEVYSRQLLAVWMLGQGQDVAGLGSDVVDLQRRAEVVAQG